MIGNWIERCADRQFGETVPESALPHSRRAHGIGAHFETDGPAGEDLVPEPAHEVEKDLPMNWANE